MTYFDNSTPMRGKRYGNPRAESYMTMREALLDGTAAIPPNQELLTELLAVQSEERQPHLRRAQRQRLRLYRQEP